MIGECHKTALLFSLHGKKTMVTKLKNEELWAVLVELVSKGELKSLPCAEESLPQVGDVICYESKDELGSAAGAFWVYVEVTGVFPYRRQQKEAIIPGLKLVVFKLVEDLGSLSVR